MSEQPTECSFNLQSYAGSQWHLSVSSPDDSGGLLTKQTVGFPKCQHFSHACHVKSVRLHCVIGGILHTSPLWMDLLEKTRVDPPAAQLLTDSDSCLQVKVFPE